ncbi:methanol O-anthraniloyltransferase-like [Actinidia eriantha]|uniref:methanol O-anthraniloyltransferase-like n=1 Tax=Actinidia eriantha TaxID=165200 RepID=UPI00258CB27A|nr:methanol O-anthraniloyltransferase-like [Actinidia eriantha]
MAALPPPRSLNFMVSRKPPELVVPAKPTPRKKKQLSDIDDQQGLRFHVPMIMFYQNNLAQKGIDPVKVIREALARALVYYYPFAGRLVEGPNRKLMVDCNGEGVLFIEAEADITLEELGDTIRPPCPYWEELLYDVPGSRGIVGCPLILTQVTRLTCGGFIVAIRLNHAVSDGLGLAQFLIAVAEMARDAPTPSLLPVWKRDLLKARSPPRITCMHLEYEDLEKDNAPPRTMNRQETICRSFFFGPEEMKVIKKHLLPTQSGSTFDIVTACVWRLRTIAFQVDPEELVRLTFMFNLRGNLVLNLPSGFYGNSMASPAAVSTAKTLCNNPLGYAVGLVKKAKSQVNEEYARSITDLMVIKGRPSFVMKWNYIVTDASRARFGEVDFGWGKPIYGGTTGDSWCIHACSIYTRFKNGKGQEGLVVPIRLPIEVMERFQEEMKKLIQEPVEDLYKPTVIKSVL